MRISTQQQYLKAADNMQQSQVKLANLQEQITTGKKLVNPSDDPVAAAQVIKLERELAQSEKYEDNIDVTERRLELEDTILSDINIAVDRMRELAVQAGNGVLGDQDRASISSELYQLTDYVAGLMNTQDSEGEYLFAGSKGSTQPYVASGDGSYEYMGDDGQRMIQVGSSLYVASNDSGQYLFESVEGPLEVNLTGQAVSNGNSFIAEAGFANEAAEEAFSKATDGLGDLSVTVAGTVGNYSYTISDSGGNTLDSAAFVPGDTVEYEGLTFELDRTPMVSTDSDENTMVINTSSERKNILEVATDLASVLAKPVESAEDQTALNEAVATGISQFEEGAEQMLAARSTLGSRLQTLEYATSSNLDFQLITESTLSSLEDASLDEVISQFKLEEITLEAAQATFGQVTSLSLFNYIS
ncbi:flagellar hook-associated protein FlgL [Amphritea sp. 2_MG-2023]|uniref:flagellar hook-associated protein FlgL n=1 Tax=Amphritea TaxID=515417 RepID=UPI001C066066|nr:MULTISPECIES: flagellar hook-associated protein FlgL [Amphritea]MBU2964840.1 flagellar hook-associated protein FlgL [Amphritea atlantica]MDO6419585.1 flagellar hook-associated protein FlgL [Amphritea sp. 2_MG-2023]